MDNLEAPAQATTFPLADGAWVIVSGDLDREQVGAIRDEVLGPAGRGRLVLDLRGAGFVGAAAVGLVCEAAERSPERVAVIAAPPVRRLLALCGLEPDAVDLWADAEVLLASVEAPRGAPDGRPPAGRVDPWRCEELVQEHHELRARFAWLDRRRREAVVRAQRLCGEV